MLLPDRVGDEKQLYMQAIALDSDFALASCPAGLCLCRDFPLLRTDRGLGKPKLALKLHHCPCVSNPDLAEAHLALGQCIYWMDQDYERALEQFDIAARFIAEQRRYCAFDCGNQTPPGLSGNQALEEYERVAKLDPLNPNTQSGNSSLRTRRCVVGGEGARWVEQPGSQMAPASIIAKIQEV